MSNNQKETKEAKTMFDSMFIVDFEVLFMGVEVELDTERINANRVDTVHAALLTGPTLDQIRKSTAYDRAKIIIQKIDIYYKQKDLHKAGLVEVAKADGAFVTVEGEERFLGFAAMKPERVEESALSRMGAFKVAPSGEVYVNEKSGIVRNIAKDYSDEIVLLNCQGANLGNGRNIISAILGAKSILKVETDGVCRLYYEAANEYYYDIRFNCSVPKYGINPGRKLNGFPEGAKITVYVPFNASASMQRNFSIYLLKVDREEVVAAQAAAALKEKEEEILQILEEGVQLSYKKGMSKAHAILNALSGGVYSRLKNSWEGKAMSLEDRNKMASRMGLGMTNSKELGIVTKFAFCNYEKPERDGQGFFNAEFLSAAYAEKHPEAAPVNFNGKWVQARLMSSMKGGHICITPEGMKEVILADGSEIVFLEKKNLTDAFKKYVDGNGSNIMKKKYDGKILVWGTTNLEDVEFFGDLTVFKTIPEFGTPMPVALMDMNKSVSKTVATSNQVIAKMLRVPEGKGVLEQLFKEAIDKNFKFEEKENIRSFSEFGTVEYGVDMLMKINPEFVLKDENLTRAVLEAAVKSSTNMLSGLNVPVEGFNGIMVPDFGAIFGIKLINDNEFFCPGLTDKYIGRKAEMVRHPSSSAGEHVCLKAISLKKVLVRIAKEKVFGHLTEGQAAFLSDLFNHLEGNIVILPVNPVIVNKLGGADWDGDTVNVYLDERIVTILNQVPEEAIDYGKIKSSGVMVKLDDRMIVDAYKAYADCGNRPIGMVVDFILAMTGTLAAIKSGKFARHGIQSLLFHMKAKAKAKAEAKIKAVIQGKAIAAESPEELFGVFDSNKTYESQFVGDNLFIDAARREEFAEYIRNVGISTPENFEMFLEDAVKAYSGISNDTIDAAKKGGKVDCWFYDLNQFIEGGLLAPVTFEYDENDKLIVNAPELGLINDNGTLKYVSEDYGAEVKAIAAQYLRDKIEEVLAKAESLREEDAATEDFEDEIYGAQDFFRADKEALKHLASMNTAINNGASSLYGDIKADVLAFARALAKNAVATPEEKYELFKEASVMKDGKRSGFYTKFGPEMLYVAMGDRDFALYSRLRSVKNGVVLENGDEIELTNGKGVNGIFAEDELTGIFEVEVVNGKAYATMSAKKYLESFMVDDNKFVITLKTRAFLNNRIDLSGKNGIARTIATANGLLKKEIDSLMEKMNSGKCEFKLRRDSYGGLVLTSREEGSGKGVEAFKIKVMTPNKVDERDNAYTDLLAGKEIELSNIISFNYWKEGTTRKTSVPEFVVALTGNIIK